MVLEEELELAPESESGEEGGEAGGEAEEEAADIESIDINASLLEAMIRRTEILEKLAANAITVKEATKLLAEIPVPSTQRRRRRRK